MSTTILYNSADDFLTTNTYFPGGVAGGMGTTTETDAQVPFRVTGSVGRMHVHTTELNQGPVTIFLRKNQVSTDLSIFIPNYGSGHFYDVTHVVTVAPGDKLTWLIQPGASANASFTLVGGLFTTPDTNTVSKWHVGKGIAPVSTFSVSARNTSWFFPICGDFAVTTSESQQQVRMPVAGTWKNGFVNVSGNSRTIATTVAFRVAAANTALTISIAAAQTGIVEDTTHTVTVAANSLLNYSVVTGNSATGTLTLNSVGSDMVSSTGAFGFCSGQANLQGFFQVWNFTTPNWFPLGEWHNWSVSLAAHLQVTGTFSGLSINSIANTMTGTTTVRVAFAAISQPWDDVVPLYLGNVQLSIAASTSGVFQDTTHTDVMTSAMQRYTIYFQTVNSGNGELTFTTLASQLIIGLISPGIQMPMRMMMGMGV